MDSALMQQSLVIQSLQRTLPNFRKLGKSNWTAAKIRNRLTTLKELWAKCQELHYQLVEVATAEEKRATEYFSADKFLEAEDCFNSTSDFMMDALESVETTPSASTSHDVSLAQRDAVHANTVNDLPIIELPKFTGNYVEWESFRDRFTSLIIDREGLTNARRMHYLLSCLSGTANACISTLQISDANFKIAWDALKARFENKRRLIQVHLDNFYNISKMKTGSALELTVLRDKTNIFIASLRNLDQPVDSWDVLIVHRVSQCFDTNSRQAWELKVGGDMNYPTWESLSKFLDSRIRALENIDITSGSKQALERPAPRSTSRTLQTHHGASDSLKEQCNLCKGNHFLNSCPTFKIKSPSQRLAIVKQEKRCINCLSKHHYTKDCGSKFTCRTCRKKHHTMLHFTAPMIKNETSSVESTAENPNNSTVPLISHTSAKATKFSSQVLLATAWVRVSSPSGRSQRVRALLDQGSEATFISEDLAQSLRVPRELVHVSISGIGESRAGIAKHSALISIGPHDGDGPAYSTNALILSSLTSYTRPSLTTVTNWNHIQGLKLADPHFSYSLPIQLIIGADIYGSLLRDGIRHGSSNEPLAQNTVLGWVLSGPVPPTTNSMSTSICVNFAVSSESLDLELRRFWEVEEVPRTFELSPEDKQCEEHFSSTYTRSPDGRYIVRLPFKTEPPICIGDTYSKAYAMLMRLNRQLESKHPLALEYSKFLREYEQLAHMELIPRGENTVESQSVYIPHQAVVHVINGAVKVRVVFNASCLSSNGSSLNDHLLVGPKLQADLPAIILQWRQWRYVFAADITKMYRQILVDRRDTDFQRILWSDETGHIQHYRLLTVTYGTSPAPFLALRVLRQLADDEGAQFPLAVPILQHNTYVDDCLFGADNTDSAQLQRDDLISLLAKAGFTLHKWASNETGLLEKFGPSEVVPVVKEVNSDNSLKILGLVWNPSTDNFIFSVTQSDTVPDTKRTVLSAIAKLYDPLGWAIPVTIVAKLFMQQLWLQKGGWDDKLPDHLLEKWVTYFTSLPRLNNITIPRWTQQGSRVKSMQIHGFSDASNAAYAGVVYLRLELHSGKVTTSLLTAKSRVAPLKTMTTPRLELSAAVLLADLIKFVRSNLQLNSIAVYCWTDATIVLAWVSQHSSRWRTFVANRVQAIHSQLPTATWGYVPSAENPADCGSRGISVSEYAQHDLWWNGPDWLRQAPESWPIIPSAAISETVLELKSTVTVSQACQHVAWDLATRYSDWSKLLRVTAYVLRFISRCRVSREHTPQCSKPVSPKALCSTEVKQAKIFWLSYIQRESFLDDISNIQHSQSISRRSSLASLHPFLDSDGLLRVGGRLRHADLSYESKHPIVLKSHYLVTLLIKDLHIGLLHSGLQLTLCALRCEYWLLRARTVIRAVIYKCVACTREKAEVPTQLMGDLPEARVKQTCRAFLHSGVDYAGPYLIRSASGRGYKSHKAYISLFVCLTTRSVHLELVNDYSSKAFLATFIRFSARRGLPAAMYSDNGTPFQGADRELSESFALAISNPDFQNKLATDGVAWHFLPPSAPHFGGLWEAGVRSVKHHLKRIVGVHTLTYEEFTTLLTQIEACLNSRPLVPLSDCIDDYSVLTPGHFLIGSPLTTVPAPTLLDLQESRLSRWQLVRRMYESFWKRWSSEYVSTLQSRSKWRIAKDEIKLGSIVLLRNSSLPPCKWELGRIVQCFRGDDNLVRVVKVKTARSEYIRPITKVCILPVE